MKFTVTYTETMEYEYEIDAADEAEAREEFERMIDEGLQYPCGEITDTNYEVHPITWNET